MACYQFSLLSLYMMMYFPSLQPRMESGNHSAPSYSLFRRNGLSLPYLFLSLHLVARETLGLVSSGMSQWLSRQDTGSHRVDHFKAGPGALVNGICLFCLATGISLRTMTC